MEAGDHHDLIAVSSIEDNVREALEYGLSDGAIDDGIVGRGISDDPEHPGHLIHIGDP